MNQPTLNIKKLFITGILTIILTLSGCQATYNKVNVVKPKRHFGRYDAKKDRYKKRVKTTKFKSLKRTKIKNEKK